MNRFSMGKRVQSLIVVLAAAGAFAVLFSVLSAFAADDVDANAKALTTLDDDWSKAAATKSCHPD